MDRKLFFIAGEASGDLSAAHLIKEIKKLSPSIEITGIGGKKMQEAGLRIIFPAEKIGITGFFEVISKIGLLKNVFDSCIKHLDEYRPDALVLVDYPGFNLRIAKQAKKRNIPVIYFISPQVWAWGSERIESIKKYVDRMMVVFGFEEEIYKKHNVPVKFVGHPLLDIVKPQLDRNCFRKTHNISENVSLIALLPGSRNNEVQRLLPVFILSAEIIRQEIKDAMFIIAKSPFLIENIYKTYLQKSKLPILLNNSTYNILNGSDVAIVCSGTATLETAIIGTPMVVAYKTSLLSFLLAKRLVKIKNMALVNVIAGKRIVPEYVQKKASAENIAKEVISILKNKEKYINIKEDLRRVKEKLGSPGAGKRAAWEIINFLNGL
jgi:lipid-A-disaccharide synthase